MAEPIYPAIETDPEELVEIAYDYLRAQIPGWEPAPMALDARMLQSAARIIAEGRDTAADVLPTILRWFGQSIIRLAPLEAAAATVDATVTVRDDAGYTLPAGLEVFVRTSGDDGHTFEVAAPVTIPPGQTQTARGEVQLRAVEPGAQANGLNAGNEVEPIRPLEWIDKIELAGTSSGGVDAESDEAYVARLVDELALATPAPILPGDFEVLARRVPAVHRALALNLYDPDTGSWDNERTVTVAVVDANGAALSSGVKSDVRALLESMREVNWRVHVIDPTYTEVEVEFDAVALPGEDPETVREAAIAAVAAYLAPGSWGSLPTGDQTAWRNVDTVRYLEVAQAINEAPGVDYIAALRIGLEGRTLGTSDVRLDGPAALPRPGTITGTVREG